MHSIDIMSNFFLHLLLMLLQFIKTFFGQSVSFSDLFFEVFPFLLANAFGLVLKDVQVARVAAVGEKTVR